MNRPAPPRSSVQILGFDGMQALDIFGPLEALASVQVAGRPAYKVRLVGLQGRRFSSETGIVFEADFDTSESGTADTLSPAAQDYGAQTSWTRQQMGLGSGPKRPAHRFSLYRGLRFGGGWTAGRSPCDDALALHRRSGAAIPLDRH